MIFDKAKRKERFSLCIFPVECDRRVYWLEPVTIIYERREEWNILGRRSWWSIEEIIPRKNKFAD